MREKGLKASKKFRDATERAGEAGMRRYADPNRSFIQYARPPQVSPCGGFSIVTKK